jgi:hypothetical protein
MGGDRRVSAGATVLIAMVIAACGGSSGSDVSAPPSGPSSVSPTPSTMAEPSSPVSPPSPSAATASWYPWLPAIDTTVDAAFQIDTFVMAQAEVVPVSDTPGGPSFRFDTGDPDPSTHPLMGFRKDGLLVVLHGPVVVADIQWYFLAPAQLAVDVPTGWSPAWTPDGTAYLRRSVFACPTDPMTTEQLERIVLTDGLPACFGDTEVTIVGDLRCDAEADTFATGAAWLTGGICRFETPPVVYGLDPDLEPGRYAVTGHFQDEQARDCRSLDGDESAQGRLGAVLHCRRAFLATSVERVSG